MSKRVQILFWLSFLYVTVALSFWGKSLFDSSVEIIQLKKEILRSKYSDHSDPKYLTQLELLENQILLKKKQYWGEGLTFFAFISLSGIIVYFSLRREAERNQFQRNVLLSITHELKTPIASIKLALQTLQKRSLKPEVQEEILDLANTEINRLNELTDNILYVNKLESNQIQTQKNQIEIHELLDSIRREYLVSQNTHQIIIEGPDFQIVTDEFLLSLAISNLVNNAIKYSTGSQEIILKTLHSDDTKAVKIIDFGKGIAPEEREKVLKKYYRTGNELTRSTKGTGLGLYIVKQICDKLNYKLDYDYIGHESIFTITFKT